MDMMTRMCGGEEMSELNQKKCIPCQGGVPPMNKDEIAELIPKIDAGWQVIDDHHLRKAWAFPDFSKALEFVNSAGQICEEEGHHADFELGWGRVIVKIYTHKINGLVESDFILAAKIDQL
mgnify:FL=1